MTASSREPLIIRGAIVAAVTAIIHFLVLTNIVGLTPEQETALGGVVDLVGTAVLVVWARGAVTPTADVAAREAHSGNLVAGPAAEEHTMDVAEGEPVEVIPEMPAHIRRD